MEKILDNVLDSIPNRADRAYDMRHAMLYLAHPDVYERIISTRDKERIIDRYRERIEGPVPSDVDEAIRKIREALSDTYDKPDRAFDFYQDLKNEWKPGTALPRSVVKVSKDIGTVTVPEGEELPGKAAKDPIEARAHTEIQWMLLKLGGDMGLDLWVAKNDRNKVVIKTDNLISPIKPFLFKNTPF